MLVFPSNPDPEETSPRQDETFIGLITQHQKSILGFLVALVPSITDAEDILQRTNLVLWRKREQYEPHTNFKAWAFAIARWEALSFLKECKRGGWLIFNDKLADLVAERMAGFPDSKVNAIPDSLRQCMAKLSDSNRRLLQERYSNNLSLKQCAELFDRSEGSLKVTLHRLRIALRRCISKYPQTRSSS